MPMRTIFEELHDQHEIMRGRLLEQIDDVLLLLEEASRLVREDKIEAVRITPTGESLKVTLGGLLTLRKAIKACQMKAEQIQNPEARAALI